MCKNYKQVLIEFYYGSKINPESGEDYIMQGAKFDSHECIEWLCQQGESLWRTNKAGETALNIAILNNALKSEEVIRKYHDKHEKLLLLIQAYYGHCDTTSQGLGYMCHSLTETQLYEIFKYLI